jgi:CheY-like chemotaxis protein
VDTWLGSRHQGLDLLQLLKLDRETASIPVVIVSSDDPKAITERLSTPPRNGITLLLKPFDPEELLEVVKETLERRHA